MPSRKHFACKEETDGKVTVISMGPPQAEEALREALALGADHAVLMTDRLFAGADTWATARTLATTLEKTGPFDPILAGEKGTDGETGQVGPEVAIMMGMPFSTYVSDVALESSRVKVPRTVEKGTQVQSLPTPCLLTVLHDLNEPEMPTLAGKVKARRSEVKRPTLANLDLPQEKTGLTGSPTRVVKIARPQLTRSTETFSGNDLEKGLDWTGSWRSCGPRPCCRREPSCTITTKPFGAASSPKCGTRRSIPSRESFWARAHELDDIQMELIRRVKLAFDPNNILNPGKIVPWPEGPDQ